MLFATMIFELKINLFSLLHRNVFSICLFHFENAIRLILAIRWLLKIHYTTQKYIPYVANFKKKPAWNGFQALSALPVCNFSLVCNFLPVWPAQRRLLSSSWILIFPLNLCQTHWYSLRHIKIYWDSLRLTETHGYSWRLIETHWGSLRLI